MSILRILGGNCYKCSMRFPLFVAVCILVCAFTARASEPIKAYAGKAHEWAIKFDNVRSKQNAAGEKLSARFRQDQGAPDRL
jgi:hypothetical protein